MANKKFSQFTEQLSLGSTGFLVGYDSTNNTRISLASLVSSFPIASATTTGLLSSSNWSSFSGKISSVTTNNVLYVSKNGNDGTGTRNLLTRPFLTIQAAITAASAGDMVYVYPGTYSESIVLKNGVNIYLTDGAIISDTSTSVVTDNGVAVTCVIDGYGEIKNTSTSTNKYAIYITNSSSEITIRAKYVECSGTSGGCLYVMNGTIRYDVTKTYAKLGGSNKAVYADAGTLYIKGELISDVDYTVLISGATVYMDATVRALSIGTFGNSGLHLAGNGYLDFTGSSTSNVLYGLEQTGGTAYIHDATLESKNATSASLGSAVSYYGGTLLELSNVILRCANASAKSIETQGVSNRTVKVYTSSYATNSYQATPAINFTFGKQNLLVAGTNLAHAALNTDAKVVVDQLAMNVPSDNNIIKYSGTSSKAEWSTPLSLGIGLDDVLSVGQSLAASRIFDFNNKDVEFSNNKSTIFTLNSTGGTVFEINDAAKTIQIGDPSPDDFISCITSVFNSTNCYAQFYTYYNDFISPANQLRLKQDGKLATIQTEYNSTINGISLDFTNNSYKFGDWDSNLTGTSQSYLFCDNVSGSVYIRTYDSINTNVYLGMSIEAGSDVISASRNGSGIGFLCDFANEQYKFGDYDSILRANAYMYIDGYFKALHIGTNELEFDSAAMISPSAGSISGQHLVIKVAGTTYKIELRNP